MTENAKGVFPKLPRWIYSLGLIVFAAWSFWHLFSFNDRFESLGALFSGLAFIGLIATLVYQSQELAIQRDIQRENQTALMETANANRDSVELSGKNLRAQFLIFWLEINKDYHDMLRKFERTVKNPHAEMRVLADALKEAEVISGQKYSPREPKQGDRAHMGCIHTPHMPWQEDARAPYYEILHEVVAKHVAPWIENEYLAKLKELEELTQLKIQEGAMSRPQGRPISS